MEERRSPRVKKPSVRQDPEYPTPNYQVAWKHLKTYGGGTNKAGVLRAGEPAHWDQDCHRGHGCSRGGQWQGEHLLVGVRACVSVQSVGECSVWAA
jgi:hypothetical protein